MRRIGLKRIFITTKTTSRMSVHWSSLRIFHAPRLKKKYSLVLLSNLSKSRTSTLLNVARLPSDCSEIKMRFIREFSYLA